MKTLVLVALLAAPSVAEVVNVIVDAQANVLRLSSGTGLAAGPDQSLETADAPRAAMLPGALDEEFGRCKWRVVAGVVTPQVPRWPVPASAKRDAAKRLRRMIHESLSDIVTLKEWQSDPANVAVLDRANELTVAQQRLVELRDILAGP